MLCELLPSAEATNLHSLGGAPARKGGGAVLRWACSRPTLRRPRNGARSRARSRLPRIFLASAASSGFMHCLASAPQLRPRKRAAKPAQAESACSHSRSRGSISPCTTLAAPCPAGSAARMTSSRRGWKNGCCSARSIVILSPGSRRSASNKNAARLGGQRCPGACGCNAGGHCCGLKAGACFGKSGKRTTVPLDGFPNNATILCTTRMAAEPGKRETPLKSSAATQPSAQTSAGYENQGGPIKISGARYGSVPCSNPCRSTSVWLGRHRSFGSPGSA